MEELGFAILIGLLFLVFVYFIPFIIAWWRGHENTGWVLILNILIGWTVIGWFFALFWGCFGQKKTNTFIGEVKDLITTIRAPTSQEKVVVPPSRPPNPKRYLPQPQLLEEEWWIGIDGKQEGPFKVAEIKELLALGEVTTNSHVWKNGMGKWKLISEVKSFQF